MKKIPLSGGTAYALIDDEDYAKVAGYRWKLTRDGYAVARVTVFMHKLIKPSVRPNLTDHRNRNRLDNRRNNLRVASYEQNRWNSRGNGKRSSKIVSIGVDYIPSSKVYVARMLHRGKRLYLGKFKTEHRAAMMYDFWVSVLRDDGALTNFNVVAKG